MKKIPAYWLLKLNKWPKKKKNQENIHFKVSNSLKRKIAESYLSSLF